MKGGKIDSVREGKGEFCDFVIGNGSHALGRQVLAQVATRKLHHRYAARLEGLIDAELFHAVPLTGRIAVGGDNDV